MHAHTTLVIVAYNSAHLLEERLRALATRPVVIVDNASADGTVEILESRFPEVDLVRNAVNGGYGRAANLGFDRVRTQYGLLLNPDARISEEGIAALEAEAANLDGDWLFIAPDVGISPMQPERESETLDRVTHASGAALFFDMEALRRLGGFDPNIFLFFEETDLCRRAHEASVAMYHAREIEVEHELGTSTHPTPGLEYLRKWHYSWSRLYFYRKHRMWRPLLAAIFQNLIVGGFKLSLPGRSDEKRRLLHARHHSTRAFVSGRLAFDPTGTPSAESLLRISEGDGRQP
jgi:N-acetylglucosaminyl-diphospho-decaprenol L-rhamnosyltransferase